MPVGENKFGLSCGSHNHPIGMYVCLFFLHTLYIIDLSINAMFNYPVEGIFRPSITVGADDLYYHLSVFT